jgi:hypothetical protein
MREKGREELKSDGKLSCKMNSCATKVSNLHRKERGAEK